MKQVKNVLTEYDSVLVEALKFLHRVEERRAMAVGTVNDAGNDSACDADDSEVVENDADTHDARDAVGDATSDTVLAGDTETGDIDEKIEVGHKVKKFFSKMGWYKGKGMKTIPPDDDDDNNNMVNIYHIKFNDGEEQLWGQDGFDINETHASIAIGDIGYKCVE